MTRHPRTLVAGLVLLASLPALQGAEPIWKLKIATIAPRGSIWFNELGRVADEWKRASRGRTEMVAYWGGTQGDEEAVIRRIRLGQLQGAWLTAIGLSRIDEGFHALNMPLFYHSTDELFCVVDRLMPALSSRAEARGFVVVSPGYAGWVQAFTTRLVNTLGELKHLRIFTSVGDERMVRWYKDHGFRPVALATTDLAASLIRGQIEALPVTPLTALSMQYYSRVPHMLEVDLAPLPGALMLSVEAWKALPPDLQASLTAAATAAWKRMQVSVPDADRRAVEAMRKHEKFSVTRVKGTPADAAFDELAHDYAGSLRGDWVPADVYDLALAHRDACRAVVPGPVRKDMTTVKP